MPFNLRQLYYIIILTYFLTSCNGEQTQTNDKITGKTKEVKMLYYNEAFMFDATSSLKVDGYYQVRQIFGSYTTNSKDFQTHEPTFGYLQFFPDGFCKVGWWNGFFQSPKEIEKEIGNNRSFGFWGIYKTKADSLYLEYLYNPASSGANPFEERTTIVGLIKESEIIIIQDDNIKYSFPNNPNDSLTSSCIGKFVNTPTKYDEADNYLKTNISK